MLAVCLYHKEKSILEPHTVFGLSELPPPAGRVRAIRVRLASGLSRWPSGPSGRATPCPGPVGLVFESQRASDAPEGQHPDPRSGRSACSLPRISFKTPCLLGLMRMPCAQDPTRTPVRRGPCISAPPRDPPAEAATSLADAGPRDRAAPAKFNTTQTASISVASRVPYLQHATRRSPRQGVGVDPRDPPGLRPASGGVPPRCRRHASRQSGVLSRLLTHQSRRSSGLAAVPGICVPDSRAARRMFGAGPHTTSSCYVVGRSLGRVDRLGLRNLLRRCRRATPCVSRLEPGQPSCRLACVSVGFRKGGGKGWGCGFAAPACVAHPLAPAFALPRSPSGTSGNSNGDPITTAPAWHNIWRLPAPKTPGQEPHVVPRCQAPPTASAPARSGDATAGGSGLGCPRPAHATPTTGVPPTPSGTSAHHGVHLHHGEQARLPVPLDLDCLAAARGLEVSEGRV